VLSAETIPLSSVISCGLMELTPAIALSALATRFSSSRARGGVGNQVAVFKVSVLEIVEPYQPVPGFPVEAVVSWNRLCLVGWCCKRLVVSMGPPRM